MIYLFCCTFLQHKIVFCCITNFSNYLICIMKLQVFMVLWFVVKSPLVLGSRFVATSRFICIAG